MPKPSPTWLQLHLYKNESYLSDESRLTTLVGQLPHPEAQTPGLALFLGKKHKDIALAQIFHQNYAQRRPPRQLSSITIDVDRVSERSPSPIFYADADAELENACRTKPRVRESTNVHCMGTKRSSPMIHLIAEILLDFADLVYIFADDYGGATGVNDILRAVQSASPRCDPRREFRSTLFIVHQHHEQIECKESKVLDWAYDGGVSNVFMSVNRIVLPDRCIPQFTRHLPLQEHVRRNVNARLDMRAKSHLLFSARHFESLLSRAIQHVLETSGYQVNYLHLARLDFREPVKAKHLENFIRCDRELKAPLDTVEVYLASCLLADAYPPKMHKFEPSSLFKDLYALDCRHASRALSESTSFADHMSNQVQVHFASLFENLLRGGTVQAQKLLQAKQSSDWLRQITSHHSCFSCFTGPPEHALVCAHAICDLCVERYGKGVLGFEHHFLVPECPICATPNARMIKLKPSTAGPRLLSIDGGGPRGVVPLETLLLLQEFLGPGCTIQELFDYTIGTSAGGLIILALFAKGWSIARAKTTFAAFTKRFFESIPSQKSTSFLDRCGRMFKSVISDGIYDVASLENTLSDLFGATSRVFDFELSVVSGTKLAVTAATDVKPTARLFGNYNGHVEVHPESGYLIERPRCIRDEAHLWQAGRATTAVPILFPPVNIPSLGTFWDGALSRHNNPVNLALWEVARIWPQTSEPDVVVSLGTGTSDVSAEKSVTPSAWDMISKRGIPRLWATLMLFLEGEEPWKDLKNRLNEKARQDYFRFNISIPGKLPPINDTKCMDYLSDYVRTQSQSQPDFFEAISALLISCFFFELAGHATRYVGRLHYRGTLRCRVAQPRSLIKALLDTHAAKMELYDGTRSLGSVLSAENVCSTCSRYCLPLEFLVDSSSQPLDLRFQWSRDQEQQQTRRVSSMPKPISWFEETQTFDGPFGSVSHGRPGKFECPTCSECVEQESHESQATLPARGQKRMLDHGESFLPTRKRCMRSAKQQNVDISKFED